MKRTLALVVSAAALVSPVGCFADGAVWGVGLGWADSWSAPVAIEESDKYAGVDISFTPIPTFGLYHYFDGDESLTAPYVACDLGPVAAFFMAGLYGDINWWPVLKPVVGWYGWSESPEERGWLTGFKAGAAVRLVETDGAVWFASYEHGWFNAHDAVGEDDARFQTARFAVFCFLEL